MGAEVLFKSVPPLFAAIVGCGQPGIEPFEQLPILGAQTGRGPAVARRRLPGLLPPHGGSIRHKDSSIEMIAQSQRDTARHHAERDVPMHTDLQVESAQLAFAAGLSRQS